MDINVVMLVIVLLASGILAVLFVLRQKRSRKLQQKFGPEYERTMRDVGDQRQAEKELESREKRVKSFKLHSLTPEQNRLFVERWRSVQALFVDNPSQAVKEADLLLKDAMKARGYPVGDFEQRAADLSVDYPRVVQNYRAADQIVQRNSRGEATTEDLRVVMVYYRELFEDLLEAPKGKKERREFEEALR